MSLADKQSPLILTEKSNYTLKKYIKIHDTVDH